MYSINSNNYVGFSHGTYIENDPLQYEFFAEKTVLTQSQEIHFHDDIELFFVVEGNANLTINGEINQVGKGDLVILMPYHVHSIKLSSPSMKIYRCNVSIGLLLFSSISRTVEKHVSYSLAYGNVIASFSGREKKELHKAFKEIIHELKEDHILGNMVALTVLIKIILLFSRKISETLTDSQTFDHNITWKLMQYVNTNFNNDITAKSLAAEFSLTPLSVNHHFYLLTGENLSENLHRARIRYACSMLQFQQLSSSFIGKYVGYKNTSSFFRKFKDIKNVTPDEYRKSHLPEDIIYKTLTPSWKILLYLFEHYAEPINEESLAAELFLSPEMIRTELLSNFDLSLPQLVTKIRIQYARSFLQVLDIPILKIAYLCGFSSVRTFNRSFKDIMGCTPMEFQKTSLAIR